MSAAERPAAVNDMVVYRAARWQVVRVVPQIQSADYTAPHRPDRLRLFRSATGEAIWADAPDVTPTGEIHGQAIP